MANTVLESIVELLTREGARYEVIRHEPASTSEESARARGTEVRAGAKALLMKAGTKYAVFVISAACKADSQAIKERLGVKKLRFASTEELRELTGLEPGSLPPFGRPVLPFDIYLDPALLAMKNIAFNAGRRDVSILMNADDYVKVVRATIFPFSVRT